MSLLVLVRQVDQAGRGSDGLHWELESGWMVSRSVTSGCLVVGSFLGSWRPNAGAVDGSDGAVRDRGSDSRS
jgi:hypothetical protein